MGTADSARVAARVLEWVESQAVELKEEDLSVIPPADRQGLIADAIRSYIRYGDPSSVLAAGDSAMVKAQLAALAASGDSALAALWVSAREHEAAQCRARSARFDSIIARQKAVSDSTRSAARLAYESARIPALDFHYWRLSLLGVGACLSPFAGVYKVPPEVTEVPAYPADGGSAGPINPNLQLASDLLRPMDFTVAWGSSFNNRRVMVELGAGGELLAESWNAPAGESSGEAFGNINERNYEGGNGDTLGYARGDGTALTWYTLNSVFNPYLFAQVGTPISKHLRLAGGFRTSVENFTIENGWDRYDTYEVYKRYQFATLITGMPYLSLSTVWGNDLGVSSGWWNDTLQAYEYQPTGLAGSWGFTLYGGAKFVMGDVQSALAKQMDVVLQQPAWVLGISMDIYLWKASRAYCRKLDAGFLGNTGP
jgi:hypothetical protein